MKAVSIKQPWASLIAHGIKNIENRTWKTKFRGKIYIHASAKDAGALYELLNEKQIDAMNNHWTDSPYPNRPLSAIIGEVDIVDCVVNHPSIWAEKTPYPNWKVQPIIYNWVLANPVLYDKPILNVKGKLSFWETDYQHCEDCMKPFHVDSMVILEDCWTCSNCLNKHTKKLKKNSKEKPKLYFRSIDDTTCHSFDWFMEDAKLEELQEITLFEAIPDKDTKDYVWCTHYENTEEKNQCRKSFCPSYESKSGRGICEHRGHLYQHGEEVTFKVE